MAYKRFGAIYIDGTEFPQVQNHKLYRVPEGYESVVSSIHIFNQTNAALSDVRVAHVDGPISDISLADYIIKGASIPEGEYMNFQVGICMSSGDSILIYSNGTGVNFIAWGEEIKLS